MLTRWADFLTRRNPSLHTCQLRGLVYESFVSIEAMRRVPMTMQEGYLTLKGR